MQTLLDGGANINAVDSDGRAPIHLAVEANDGNTNSSTDLEELLISRGCNMLIKDKFERLPLSYAFTRLNK